MKDNIYYPIRLGIIIAVAITGLILCSSCATRYVQCDAYGANDVPTEIDRV